jgi:hypothetical protein
MIPACRWSAGLALPRWSTSGPPESPLHVSALPFRKPAGTRPSVQYTAPGSFRKGSPSGRGTCSRRAGRRAGGRQTTPPTCTEHAGLQHGAIINLWGVADAGGHQRQVGSAQGFGKGALLSGSGIGGGVHASAKGGIASKGCGQFSAAGGPLAGSGAAALSATRGPTHRQACPPISWPSPSKTPSNCRQRVALCGVELPSSQGAVNGLAMHSTGVKLQQGNVVAEGCRLVLLVAAGSGALAGMDGRCQVQATAQHPCAVGVAFGQGAGLVHTQPAATLRCLLT